MDNSGNGFIEWLFKQGSLGAILGVVLFVGYNSINDKIDSVSTSLNNKIDSVSTSLNARIDSVNVRIDGIQADIKEIKDRGKWFMDHVIKNGDRISKLEGQLAREQGSS